MQREATDETVWRQAVRKLDVFELEQVVGGKSCASCGADLDEGTG